MMPAVAEWLRESFHQPWALLLLPLAALPWWGARRERRPTLVYSSTEPLEQVGRTWAVRLQPLPRVLRTLTVAMLVLCLAQPRKGNQQTRLKSEGIAIQLVVDRSGSMSALDLSPPGRRVDRLDTVKTVVRDFVIGGGGLRGRTDDLAGAIVFAAQADSICPLTLDHAFLVESLGKVKLARGRGEDGTAIGDGLALAVERLKTLDQQRLLAGAQKIKSRIIILLTDGENNAGDIEPRKAAELAATFGIKVYTIGAGTRGMAPSLVVDPFTGQERYNQVPVSIDEDTLRDIATKTGGSYFRATDAESLRAIYATIDKMEKTSSEEKRYLNYRELATEWVRVGPLTLPPLLLVAFALGLVEVVLSNTWLRRIP